MRLNNPQRISREFQLEQVRRSHFPQLPSRLSSIYCFLGIEDAKKAASLWGGPFRDSNLVEVNLGNVIPSHKFDSNWISYYSHITGNQNYALSWMRQYWLGNPCPSHEPIWENLTEGRAIVLGTEVRKRAYEIIKLHFPESLGVLEISRIAAWLENDLGNISAYLLEEEGMIVMHYLMNWKDANDPTFFKKIDEFIKVGHPVNYNDLGPHLRQGSFGKLPDFRPLEFKRTKAEMPYILA